MRPSPPAARVPWAQGDAKHLEDRRSSVGRFLLAVGLSSKRGLRTEGTSVPRVGTVTESVDQATALDGVGGTILGIPTQSGRIPLDTQQRCGCQRWLTLRQHTPAIAASARASNPYIRPGPTRRSGVLLCRNAFGVGSLDAEVSGLKDGEGVLDTSV